MASSRNALFDLAVNRAADTAQRLGAHGPAELRRHLEVWYLKTRFASRVPFEKVLEALRDRPPGTCHWQGGPAGGWQPGPPDRP